MFLRLVTARCIDSMMMYDVCHNTHLQTWRNLSDGLDAPVRPPICFDFTDSPTGPLRHNSSCWFGLMDSHVHPRGTGNSKFDSLGLSVQCNSTNLKEAY